MDFASVLSFAWGKIEPRVEGQAVQAIDLLHHDKKMIEDVKTHMLKKYGDEVYYNDLDSYISSNHVIELLIKSIRGKSNVQPRVVRSFKTENSQKFLRYNPKYKNQKVVASRIPDIFEEIFNMIHSSLLMIDPHSDLGKIQRDVQIIVESLSDEHQIMNAKIDGLQKSVSSLQSIVASNGIVDVAIEDISDRSASIDRFMGLIKDVETECQSKHQFHAALSRYYALLQSITTSLAGHSQEQINALICTLNCNIALCQCNLGLYQKALDSLAAIPKETSSKNRVYHFVFALIYIQQNDVANYPVALEHINSALEIDNNYHNAFSCKQFLMAHLYPDQIESSIENLDKHYYGMLAEKSDRDKIAEYYQFRGLINLQADHYAQAVEDFEHAMEYGYDCAIAKLNIAVTIYSEASELVSKDRRHLLPQVNQKLMLRAIESFKEVIDFLKGNADFDDIRKRAISLYTSACSTVGKKHDLSPISDYIYEGQEYEQLRVLVLGSAEELTEQQVSLLSPDDQIFVAVRNMMQNHDEIACKNYIERIVDKGEVVSAPIFHVLLQVCLITKSVADYWKYRQSVDQYGIEGNLLSSMDACAYELEGDLGHAKELFDTIALSSFDYNILENTLRFFLRNKYISEAKELFLRIHELIISASMYVEDVEMFYREANRFFIEQKDVIIEKILQELPSQKVSERCKLQLWASYYSAVNDTQGLYNCQKELSCDSDEFTNAYGMALCATRLFKYEEALQICLALEKRMPDNENKIVLFWLISDILLLKGNKEESFLWAQKAHKATSQNPYDRSHQAFFTRSFRCGNEAISEIIEYQKEHPVVVNWVKAFSISENDGDVVSTLKNALNEFSPGRAGYEEREREFVKLHKQGVIPIEFVWQRHNRVLWKLFEFASRYKLNISQGNVDVLVAEMKRINRRIVTDALTLIVMAYHNSLDVFESFEHVYINYRSITTIQQAYLSGEYPLISEILDWIQTANNIVFEADGFIDEEDQAVKLFSADYVACCNIAIKRDSPFLYCDRLAPIVQSMSESTTSPDVQFVSIPAVCNKVFALIPERLNDLLYSYLMDCTFVSFRAETILHQIRKQNYVVSEEQLAPFMFCDTNCDMHSFANVYVIAIKELYTKDRKAANDFACIVLEDAHRIWRQGTYYRLAGEEYEDISAYSKAENIANYVTEVLQGIADTFDVMDGNLLDNYNKLSSASGFVTD